jgi:hypothetical protein
MDVTAEAGPPTQSCVDDGNILVTDNGVLKRISASGGTPVVLAKPDPQKGELYYLAPQLLPTGKEILFSVSHDAPGDQLFILNPVTGEKKAPFAVADAAPQFIRASPSEATGYLTYFAPTTASLMAVPFDPDRLAVKGDPVPLLDGRGRAGLHDKSAALAGHRELGNLSLCFANRLRSTSPSSGSLLPRYPPMASWLAYTANDSGHYEIYVTSYPDAGPKITISTDGGYAPFWSRNGREFIYRIVGSHKLMSADVEISPKFRGSLHRQIACRAFLFPSGVCAYQPGYIQHGEDRIEKAETARYLLGFLHKLEAWALGEAHFADASQKARAIETIRRGIDYFESIISRA